MVMANKNWDIWDLSDIENLEIRKLGEQRSEELERREWEPVSEKETGKKRYFKGQGSQNAPRKLKRFMKINRYKKC